jgi:ABC-type Fe3+ transport system permease subunit
MNDQVIVVSTLLLALSLAVILAGRTIHAERSAGSGPHTRGRYNQSPLLRWLDFAGVTVTVLLLVAVAARVLNTVR